MPASPANDPTLRSWIDIRPTDDFPIQNLPFGVMETPEWGPRVAVAIGGYALDLYACAQLGFFDSIAEDVPALGAALPKVFRRRSLNAFLRLGPLAWRAVRERVSELLRHDNPTLRDNELAVRTCLLRQRDVAMLRPVKPTNYVDFYSSLEHATNVGAMFRPDKPLLPNWRHLPIAYHGRANSIVVSGTDVRRPQGQYRPAGQETPVFGPTQQLDFELETAFVVGRGTAQGTAVPIAQAEDHIFGLLLFNDWSARDIQSWEYQPLGPFLGKNFASSVSPWVVTLDALEPFRVAGPVQEPPPLPYLQTASDQHFDIQLEVLIQPAGSTVAPLVISHTSTKHLYWSMAQQLAHHASNGCPLDAGDLYASGTISGPTPGSLGSLLELTQRGTQPLLLPNDLQLGFLRDGDTVILRGYAEKNGLRIGLGEVRGTVLPAAE
ncbi:fumarylacetoacetase [Hymenobacter sp. HMF4947]|uniref:fumarylacetoacetase n=1 Tax=Hymenobacter ginkgonis TaxID=2682976 RepID=A0A7K1TH32_9BACT|nr:fumarylacetoacetase [Hymenobacter ginkgonis]MVN77684.1 fumarylacetoacetase [Hymenobacter ginkgonis]